MQTPCIIDIAFCWRGKTGAKNKNIWFVIQAKGREKNWCWLIKKPIKSYHWFWTRFKSFIAWSRKQRVTSPDKASINARASETVTQAALFARDESFHIKSWTRYTYSFRSNLFVIKKVIRHLLRIKNKQFLSNYFNFTLYMCTGERGSGNWQSKSLFTC